MRSRSGACGRSAAARRPQARRDYARSRRAPSPRARPRPPSASSSTRSGSCQSRQRRGLVAAQDQRELVVRRRLAQRRERVRRVGGAGAVELHARDLQRSGPPPRPARSARAAASGPGSSSSTRWGASPDRHQHHPVELQLDPRLLRADEMSQVRRVERPAEDADARHLLPDLPRALDHELVGGELARADRAARMQLLGRVADLGAHAEHAAVGEARGGVHVDAGRVDRPGEGPRGLAPSPSRSPPSGRSRSGSRARSPRPPSPRPSRRGSARGTRWPSPPRSPRASESPSPPASARVRPSTRSSTPLSRSSPSAARQEVRRGVGVHEQRLGRVAHRGALDLGVHRDRAARRPGRPWRPRTRGSCPPPRT